jgi:hypothetical protein
VNEAKEAIHIYPNPSQGRFTVNVSCEFNETIVFTLINKHGFVVGKYEVQCKNGSAILSIQRDDLPPGLYSLNYSSSHLNNSAQVFITSGTVIH